MNAVDASVVIITCNRAASLRAALESVVRQQVEGVAWEVVVIDDGSSDDTRDVVEQAARGAPVAVRCVTTKGEGIAAARNRGVVESRGEWMAFCDDDQAAEPDWLKRLLDVAAATGGRCVGGARTLRLPPGADREPALGPVARRLLGELSCDEAGNIFGGKSLPSSGNLLMRRSVLNEVGAFDEDMLIGGSDADLLRRVRRAGVVIHAAPAAVVHHIIPLERLSPAYLRRVSLRWGGQFAAMDRKRAGRVGTCFLCLARTAQALAVHAACLLWARLHGDRARAVDLACLLWRAQGYARQTLRLLAPSLFAQRRFFSALQYRQP